MGHTPKLQPPSKDHRGSICWRRVVAAALQVAEAEDDYQWRRACLRFRRAAREWWLNLPKTQ